ncbi:MAG: hypothetical protein IPN24_14010 [Betaproteobacteria bacterium]|jgi:hypothetical protein|nr:hypothetical protein [Betaproteobacteria bacterium]
MAHNFHLPRHFPASPPPLDAPDAAAGVRSDSSIMSRFPPPADGTASASVGVGMIDVRARRPASQPKTIA